MAKCRPALCAFLPVVRAFRDTGQFLHTRWRALRQRPALRIARVEPFQFATVYAWANHLKKRLLLALKRLELNAGTLNYESRLGTWA
jgi:hypothetical protein